VKLPVAIVAKHWIWPVVRIRKIPVENTAPFCVPAIKSRCTDGVNRDGKFVAQTI
jgi:hypothetical protein